MARHKQSLHGLQKKRSKMQKRYLSRCDGRVPDDDFKTVPSDTPIKECPRSVPDHIHLEGVGSVSDIPKEIFESGNGGYCGSEADAVQDISFMDYNDTNINELSKLELPPVQLSRCVQCGKEISDVISKDHLLELYGRVCYGTQSIYDLYSTLTRSAIIGGFGDLDYRHARESTFGSASEVSSPETIFDYDLSVICCWCEYSLLYGNLGTMGHSPYFTPISSPGSDSSFLHDHYTTKTVTDTDESLADGNGIPIFPLAVQSQDWLKQHDQEFVNECQAGTPDDQSKLNHWITSESLCDNSLAGTITSATTGMETQAPVQLSEECQPEKILENENRQSATSIQPNSDQSTANKKSWACPWYKKDSLKYQECSKYKLQRIKDVKQHTWRKHMKPDIYCPVCFELFANANERDEHVQQKSCDSRARPDFDGISEEQRKELNQNANRGKNEVDQWYYMWDTIFPGTCRPQSPYLGKGWEKLLPLLRNFWNKNQPKILSKALQASVPVSNPQNIQCVMDKIFDLFEAESSYWGTNPEISLEDVPSEIKHEELSIPENVFTHDSWGLAPELQDNLLEHQMMLEPDSLEQMIGNHINMDLSAGLND